MTKQRFAKMHCKITGRGERGAISVDVLRELHSIYKTHSNIVRQRHYATAAVISIMRGFNGGCMYCTHSTECLDKYTNPDKCGRFVYCTKENK